MEVTATGTLVGPKAAQALESRQYQDEVPKPDLVMSHGRCTKLTRLLERCPLTRAPPSEHGQETFTVAKHESRQVELAAAVQRVEGVGALGRRRESRAGS